MPNFDSYDVGQSVFAFLLLLKIRQKAAKKVEESLLRDPAIDKKLSMKERLPELCRILKKYPFLTINFNSNNLG